MKVWMSCAALAALVAAPAVSFAQPAPVAAPALDPKCFEAVGWEVDPASETIQVSGCRAASDIPAADGEGWIEYDRPDNGGFIRARLDSFADGKIAFLVVDNQGGSGDFGFKVTGTVGADGKLDTATQTVDDWTPPAQ